jgi:hypothetical protein
VHDDTTHTSARSALALAVTDRPAAAAGAGAVPAAHSHRPHGAAACAVPGPTHLTTTDRRVGTPGVKSITGGPGFLAPRRLRLPPLDFVK